MKQVKIFDTDVYAYVYVEHYNVLKGYTDFVSKKPKAFEKLTDREKNWRKIKYGYFVLISNYRKTPADMLDDYFSRTRIETTFKTEKEYLTLLPIRKLNDVTIRGKILSDIIDSIVRQSAHELGKVSRIITLWFLGVPRNLVSYRTAHGLANAEQRKAPYHVRQSLSHLPHLCKRLPFGSFRRIHCTLSHR